MQCHSAGYNGSLEEDETERNILLSNVRLRGFNNRPFNLPYMRRRMGLGGEVMFFNTPRSHATALGPVLHSAIHSRPNSGLLFLKEY